ncbi:hypothetical protein CRYUN_Cryun10bG0008100 [Craigia yunnanensis]
MASALAIPFSIKTRCTWSIVDIQASTFHAMTKIQCSISQTISITLEREITPRVLSLSLILNQKFAFNMMPRNHVFTEGAIPEFDWNTYCESTVIVPVIEKAVNGV